MALLTVALVIASARTSAARDSLERRADVRSLSFNEFMIDTGVAQVSVGQSLPAVSFDGANYMVVWQDERAPSGSDVYGARVSPAGVVLDPKGLAVCTAPNAQSCPSVAFLDSVCLVVWKDRRSDNNGDVYGTRVGRSGVVLDPVNIVICDAQGAQESTKVAAGDTCWLVVWQDNRLGWKIRAARVGCSGTVLDPGGFLVGAADSSQTSPAVAYDGENFLVVWQSAQYGPWTLRGARVTSSGQVLDPTGFPISGDVSQNMEPVAPSVASAGGGFLVSWQNARVPKYVFAKHVSHEGIPDDAIIPVPEVGLPQRNPSLSACGSVYLAAWEEQHGSAWWVCGARVSAEGALLDTEAIHLDSVISSQVAVAAGTDEWLITWSDNRLDPNQATIFGASVDTTGVIVSAALHISTPATFFCAQRAPAIASHDSGYIVAWESDAPIGSSGWNTDICGARLDRNGYMIDSIVISIASRARDQLTPAIACGDSNILVAWDWVSGVYATRLSYAGDMLDPGWLTISTSGATPAVAFDGTNYLIVWAESRNINGSRITQSGNILDRIAISTMSATESIPAVTFDGNNYLVSWTAGDVVWGTLVSPEGAVIDTDGFCVSGAGHRAWSPTVAAGGTGFFAAWVDYRTSWCEVFGSRISPDGQVLDTAGIMVSRWGYQPWNESDPCVASDGSSFVVLWEHCYYEPGLRGAAIGADGVRTDTFMLSSMPMNSPSPAGAYGQDGRFLAVFSAVKDPNGGGRDTVPRIWGSFVSPSGAIVEPDGSGAGRPSFSASPNPFSRTTCLRFGHELPLGTDAQVVIRDAAGRCVQVLTCAQADGLDWNATDAAGHRLPAGIYFCTLRTGAVTARLKLVKLD